MCLKSIYFFMCKSFSAWSHIANGLWIVCKCIRAIARTKFLKMHAMDMLQKTFSVKSEYDHETIPFLFSSCHGDVLCPSM